MCEMCKELRLKTVHNDINHASAKKHYQRQRSRNLTVHQACTGSKPAKHL